MIEKQLLNFRNNTNFALRVSTIPLAFFSFLLTQSIQILNPKHINWLYGSGDISASFIQWTYFRNSPVFQWPLTLNSKFGFPWTKTIIYTDTPPLFALPLKYLLNWVEYPVQFTGWQILISTYLIILFTSLCLRKNSENIMFALIGGFCISLTPVLLFRDVFYHYSMNVMWVIPAGIYLVLENRQHNIYLKWGLLTFITLTWMPYFVVPIAILLFVPILFELKSSIKNWRRAFYLLLAFAGSASLALVVNGFWYNASSSAGSGLGYYNANLLALINPLATQNSSWSRILPSFKNATDGQYEGFAFLGTGLVIVFSVVLILTLKRRREFLQQLQQPEIKSLLSITVLAWFLSLGFSFDFGTVHVLEIPIPKGIQQFLGVFRSSGRFIMLTSLTIAILGLKMTYKVLGRKVAIVSLLLACCITLIDSSNQIKQNKLQQSAGPLSMALNIQNSGEFLDKYAIDEVTFISPEDSAYEWKMAILAATAERNIQVNDIFAARPNQLKLDQEREITEFRFANEFPVNGEMWVLYPEFTEIHSSRVQELIDRNCSINIEQAVAISWKRCN